MALMKQAEFSVRHGVSRKTVTQWKKRGWLVFEGDLVDVVASDAMIAKYRRDGVPQADAAVTQVTHPVTQAQGNNSGNASGNSQGNGVGSALPHVEPSIGEEETPAEAAERIVLAAGVYMSMDEARRVKENYLALLNQLDYEQKAGRLIELTHAERVVFETFRGVRDAWLNWPTRVGPLIAADLGCDAGQVTGVLNAHVHKQLSILGEGSADFSQG